MVKCETVAEMGLDQKSPDIVGHKCHQDVLVTAAPVMIE